MPFKPGWISVDYINTGVTHVVVQVEDLQVHPVLEQGSEIRYHSMFSPSGTNANFMSAKDNDLIEIRTYERGVEDETLACGTGAIASALIANMRGMVSSPVRVVTRGGEELKIYFQKEAESLNKVCEVYLEGNTSIICQGQLHDEAL
jgi:diaminopimelate epimerase